MGEAQLSERDEAMLGLHEDLYALIEDRILGHERSQQTEIGPSGLGTPCVRKLGFRLAEVPPASPPRPGWRPTVGTAVHTWLASMLEAANGIDFQAAKSPAKFENRWVVEMRTPVGTIGADRVIHGNCDVYDRLTKTVIDWKIPGPAAIREYKRNGPGEEYRVQAQIYARGIARALKLPVDNVAIMFLPMNGELSERFFWWDEDGYQPEIGAQAFKRARAIQTRIDEFGAEVIIPTLKRIEDHCGNCAWFIPGGEPTGTQCPGAPSMYAEPGGDHAIGDIV